MYSSEEKILDSSELALTLARWRFQQRTIVFTNGCFDILHVGHVDYLERARQLGDVLILGLNADTSVQELKGSQRPIIPQMARARLLAALECVDAVVLFEEETPYNLIKQVKPNILVKGGDYEAENIVGHDLVMKNGGDVQVLPFVEGFSTSQIIEKIQSLSALD